MTALALFVRTSGPKKGDFWGEEGTHTLRAVSRVPIAAPRASFFSSFAGVSERPTEFIRQLGERILVESWIIDTIALQVGI